VSPAAIRVVIADDSPFVRRAFRRILGQEPAIEVVGEACDGEQALGLCRELSPHVLLLDLGMPVLDGLGVLEKLRREKPEVAVVVVSAAAQRGAEVTLLALEAGAFDFVDKAAVKLMELHELGGELVAKIKASCERERFPAQARPAPRGAFSRPEVVVVGASTGGPPALLLLLSKLPASLSAPVAVVQHIPASFVGALAERVAQATSRTVRVAERGLPLEEGTISFCSGGRDLAVHRGRDGLTLLPRNPEPGAPHVPSIDALFRSAAEVCGSRAWGVLLTGMGRDGAEGLLAIRKAGGLTVAQDETTSTVYGMPKVARELGAAFAVLSLHEIPGYLAGAVGGEMGENTGA
jgi:two-component system chemotaxis response regulator CheB